MPGRDHSSERAPTLRLIRLVAILFLPLAVVAGAVLLTLPHRMNALALESARHRGEGLTELTARLVAPALEFEAREEADHALARLAVEPELLSAVLYDDAGAAFARSPGKDSVGAAPPMPIATDTHLVGGAIEVVTPVRAAGGTAGILVVRLGLTALAERRAANMAAAGLAAAVVALVGLCFSVVTARFLVRRQTAEESLRRAAESFGALADSLPVALVIHRDERVLYTNPAGEKLLFGGRSIATGTPLSDVIRSDRPLPQPSVAGGVEECTLALADGSSLAVAVAAVPIQFHDADAVAMVAMDLSERKRLLERLVLSDRLASLGTMAAGVAHEINNPLAVVVSNAELVRQQVGERSLRAPEEYADLIAELDDVLEAADRVGRIVRDLRNLSRSEDTMGPVDLELALGKALKMINSQLRLRSRVERRFGGVPRVTGNEGRLVQVFINLLVNAAQALPDRPLEDNLIEVGTHVGADGEVVATVRDNGNGIPQAICARIFDPFFTTKAVGVGTGLGLSIVHNLVRTMGGRVELESDQRGTLFSVALPVSTEQPAPTKAPPVEPTPQRARLLVVDDEPMVCTVLERLLGTTHEVVTSGSATLALAHVDQGERFDLILCDLRMPGMSGVDLAQRLSIDHPQQRARLFFMTGDQGELVSNEELGPILEKPFTLQELSTFVGAKLDGAS